MAAVAPSVCSPPPQNNNSNISNNADGACAVPDRNLMENYYYPHKSNNSKGAGLKVRLIYGSWDHTRVSRVSLTSQIFGTWHDWSSLRPIKADQKQVKWKWSLISWSGLWNSSQLWD